VTVVYVDLDDYLAIAVEVTGLALDTILRTTDLNLADSALHAPAAGFGDPEFVAKARPAPSLKVRGSSPTTGGPGVRTPMCSTPTQRACSHAPSPPWPAS
jgi:hypothetical protein